MGVGSSFLYYDELDVIFYMETYYLIDFENVHNDGIANIESMSKTDHVHIFSTQNATNIRQDIIWLKNDIQTHLVPVRKQSLDMHLVSYLGYLLAAHGKECSYVIISKDKDYDNIVKFWKEEGYLNIFRKEKLSGNAIQSSKSTIKTKTVAASTTQKAKQSQTINSKIGTGLSYTLSGSDRCELNLYVQHALTDDFDYTIGDANRICKYVIKHCNDERMLSGIHNDIRAEFPNCYEEVYSDVKEILCKFVGDREQDTKREAQVRLFFGRYFKNKIYTECKADIIDAILSGSTKLQVNNNLMKIYSDGRVVSHIYQTIQPLIKDLPGK